MDCAGRQCNSGDRKMLRKKKNSGERKVEKRKERKQQNYYIYNGNTWGLGGSVPVVVHFQTAASKLHPGLFYHDNFPTHLQQNNAI
jgi:hypothetical protein